MERPYTSSCGTQPTPSHLEVRYPLLRGCHVRMACSPKPAPAAGRVLWDDLLDEEDRPMRKSRLTPEQVVFGLLTCDHALDYTECLRIRSVDPL